MAESSVITEEMRKLIGKEFGPKVYEVEKGAIRKFAEAIEDPNPLWQDEEFAKKTGYGGIVTPPTFCSSLPIIETQEVLMTMECPLKGVLNLGTELEFHQPLRPGDTITVTDRVADIREREGKSGKRVIITIETTYRNQRGEIVITGRQTGMRF